MFAATTSLTSLNLFGNRLGIMRCSFQACATKLQEIDISFNPLTEFPTQLMKVTALHRVYAFSCNIHKFTESSDNTAVPNLRLSELHLGNNPIKSIPDKLGFVSSLRVVGIFNCGLTRVPNAITLISHLTKVSVYYPLSLIVVSCD